MTIAITILIALFGMYLDYKAWRRIGRSSVNNCIRYAFYAVVALSYMLIVLTPMMMYFFMDEENSSFMMKFSMVLLTSYLTLTIPRLLFYIIWLPTSKKAGLWTAVTVSSLVIATFLYSIFFTRTNYMVNEVELYYDNLPEAFNGYRLAFISDIHTGSMVNAGEELAEIMELIDEDDVDMVLFGGDIINVHHSEITEQILEVFSRLKPCDGVFMVLGNHDTGAYIKNSTIAKREDNSMSVFLG